jgi:hypothetical protein
VRNAPPGIPVALMEPKLSHVCVEKQKEIKSALKCRFHQGTWGLYLKGKGSGVKNRVPGCRGLRNPRSLRWALVTPYL